MDKKGTSPPSEKPTRRGFLTKSLVAAGGVVILTSNPSFLSCHKAMGLKTENPQDTKTTPIPDKTPVELPPEKFTEKPTETHTEKSTETTAEAHSEAPAEKPAEKHPEPPAEKFVETAGEHTPPDTTQACKPTDDNIEGPYYRANTPWQTNLVPKGETGPPLLISGVVYGKDCKTPLANVIVDIWQANAAGSYDNDGNNDPPDKSTKYRGRMKTNDKGQYQYTTVIPGRYLNGATYRPSHIHYKVYGPGHQTLTTQLYFEGDPYIKGDPFVLPSLIIPLKTQGKDKVGTFDIVLKSV